MIWSEIIFEVESSKQITEKDIDSI